MARKKRAPKVAPKPNDVLRVRLDSRTIITCQRRSLDFWRSRYPGLTVLDR
jgi:hypothetical protein